MLVDIARGKAQLHLCHGAHFAPHRQPRSDQGGTFWHAAQSVVSLEPLVGEHLRIDPLAIVAHAQSELLVIVAELDLDNGGRAHRGRHSGFRLGRAVRQQVRRGLESQQQTVSGVCAIA